MALVTKHASLLERAWRRNEDVAAGAVRILGIITVEDVLEELIGEEIQDEDDYAETLTRRELTRGGTAEESASRTVDTKGVPSVRLAFDERRRRELGVADDATRRARPARAHTKSRGRLASRVSASSQRRVERRRDRGRLAVKARVLRGRLRARLLEGHAKNIRNYPQRCSRRRASFSLVSRAGALSRAAPTRSRDEHASGAS